MARGTDMGAVAVPWRPQPGRTDAFKFVKQWWAYWGYDVITADSDPDRPFSLSQARNRAVAEAERVMGAGVVILADADTVPDRLVVSKATQICNERGHVVYPFDDYRYLEHDVLSQSDEGAHAEYDEPAFPLSTFEPIWSKANSVGGILVTDTVTYWDLGGMDERFEPRWGFEDNAFVAVADTLAKVIRLPGKVYSFAHDVDGGRDWSPMNPNYWRNELYQKCYGNVKLIRELIK